MCVQSRAREPIRSSTPMLSPGRLVMREYVIDIYRPLGGLRHRKKGAPTSVNTFWQVAAFRDYADYATTDAFRTGLNELRALSRDNCCAIMCAEAVWWRCHRRIIADYLLAQGVPVMHIMGSGKVDLAKLTSGARVLTNGTLVYPAVEEAIKTKLRRSYQTFEVPATGDAYSGRSKSWSPSPAPQVRGVSVNVRNQGRSAGNK